MNYSDKNKQESKPPRRSAPLLRFYTSGSTNEDFPRDYRVFIFDAVPYKETNSQPWPYTGPDWNHGTSRGMAISTNRNEVIYWAESW